MSIVAGPPASQIWITPVAGFFPGRPARPGPRPAARRAGAGRAARPRRPAGSRGGGTPRSRSVVETSRQPSRGRRPGSVVQHEFARVDQRPEDVGQARRRGRGSSGGGRGPTGPRPRTGARDSVARKSSSTASASQRSDPASARTRPALSLASRASSVMRKSVCGRAGAFGRSQSQTAARSGRPKTRKARARSGDATRFVAISMARPPSGRRGRNRPGTPSAASSASTRTSAIRGRGTDRAKFPRSSRFPATGSEERW